MSKWHYAARLLSDQAPSVGGSRLLLVLNYDNLYLVYAVLICFLYYCNQGRMHRDNGGHCRMPFWNQCPLIFSSTLVGRNIFFHIIMVCDTFSIVIKTVYSLHFYSLFVLCSASSVMSFTSHLLFALYNQTTNFVSKFTSKNLFDYLVLT